MEKTLAQFVKALRNADVKVSPAETLDAMQVLECVGIREPVLLKNSLALALAKSPEEKARFDICFDRFFSFNAFEDLKPLTVERVAAGEQGALGGGSPQGQSLVELLVTGQRDELALRLTKAARETDVDSMRALRDKSDRVFRILQIMGIGDVDESLQEWSQEKQPNAKLNALRAAKAHLQRDVRDYVENQYLLHVDATGKRAVLEAALAAQLTQMQPAYYDEIRNVVHKLALKLTAQHRRRRKRSRRGQLNLRKTMRHNLAYDGALFDLHWRKVKVERPKVFAVCDVSGSVARVARFMLLLLYSLNELLPHIRSFAFSSQLGEVTELFDRYPVERAIEEALFMWGKGTTDYGRSLSDFRDQCLSEIDKRSTVIILGDGRNNHFDPKPEVLAEIAARAKQVLWLNPEGRDTWREGDGEMHRFAPYCFRVSTCNSVRDLERFADELLTLR